MNNLDALHDSIHEMARDEARHAAGFMGIYKRYFQESNSRIILRAIF